MTLEEATELAQQFEELIFVTVNKITGPRRENVIASLAVALVKASGEDPYPGY